DHGGQPEFTGEPIGPQEKLLVRRIDDRRLIAIQAGSERIERIVPLRPRQLAVAAPGGPSSAIPIGIEQRLSSQSDGAHRRARIAFPSLAKGNRQPKMLTNAALQDGPRVFARACRNDDALPLDDSRRRSNEPRGNSLAA